MRIFISIIFLFFIYSSAWATTWYVRDGGGTPTQCTGTTNATYPGSGNGQPCAIIHPAWVLGAAGGTAGLISSGDTVDIVGDSDTSPGTQAKYLIGFGMPNEPNTADCDISFPYQCTLNDIPAGIDASHPTSIIGIGTHQPQLWGNDRVIQVLSSPNSHVIIQNLEITDHSNCSYNDPVNPCNFSNPYGPFGVVGLVYGGDDINFSNLYIHGMAQYGTVSTNTTLGNETFTNIWVIGNGYGGFTTGTSAIGGGTLTLNQPIIDWNGCQESYPVTGGIENPSNYSNCFGQNSGGYGDGLAFGNTGNGNAGNWTIIGPGSMSFNTQDGFDTLHGTGNGNIQIDKMRFEGNAGDQIKANGQNFYLTNSIVIGDCGWWFGATQSVSGGMGIGDTCRANGDVIVFNVGDNTISNLYNNSIVSNGNIIVGYDNINNDGCNSSTKINFNNNSVLGGPVFSDDSTINPAGGDAITTLLFEENGSCTNSIWVEDYNVVTGTKSNNANCGGTHSKCGVSPGFVSQIPIGVFQGAANTFYQAWSGVTFMPISSGGASNGAGVGGLSYWNNSKTYYNNTQTSPPSFGALNLNDSATNGFTPCFFNSDCSSNMCTANVCVGGSATGDNYNNLIIKGISFK